MHPINTAKYNNCHIAVAGESGSGKTQFALKLLYKAIPKTITIGGLSLGVMC
jgi:uridine kinase